MEETTTEAAGAASSDAQGERAKAVLEGILERMAIPAAIGVSEVDERTVLDVKCENEEDVQRIIGRRGQVIDALQHLVSKALGKNRDEGFKPVVVDAADYRKRHIERLAELAERKAAECRELGEAVELNPMSAHDRRIIHVTLAEADGVRTESEGEGDDRRVVVLPA